ncbi:MAG TPA: tetratricopeptide repeat protein [Candidatus Polarisedimenticolia bacterium]|nr:tetratricopeptide repeat protein [Candidatus Polarisedimenticolia bacterium]
MTSMGRARRPYLVVPRRRSVRRLLSLAVWLCLACPGGLLAATPEELFDAANSAYESADYDAAIAGYEKILAYGLYDPRVHYNLGNAYFRKGRLGASILHYERALKIDPGDSEARQNLDLARSQIRDRMAEPELQFPLLVVRDLVDGMSINAITLLFFALYIPTTALLGAIPLSADSVRRRVFAYGAAMLGILTLVAVAGLGYKIHDATSERAIIMEERVDVLAGPGEDNTVLYTVHEGTRLDVRNRREGWLQITLPDAGAGWIPVSAAEQV